MSGSGGYYKYRCKYWLTYNCPNWVWVNNAACAHCLADGRDVEETMSSRPFRLSKEVYVPQLENGFLQYMIMEIEAIGEADSGWSVKDLSSQQSIPIATGPNAVSFGATADPDDMSRTEGGGGLQKAPRKGLSLTRASIGVD